MSRKTELILALDADTAAQARSLAAAVGERLQWVKVGKQLFTREGPALIGELREKYGKKVFLDLKFHDIPNTVEQAVRAAAAIGAEMVNVHAAGGFSMLQAAARAARENHLTLLAVTVLTSLDADELRETGIDCRPEEQVLRLTRLAGRAGVDGVVCSAREIAPLRQSMPREFRLLTPGIRPAGDDCHDQKRVMTPGQATRAGADYLVVGRPISQAPNPAAAVAAILREMETAQLPETAV